MRVRVCVCVSVCLCVCVSVCVVCACYRERERERDGAPLHVCLSQQMFSLTNVINSVILSYAALYASLNTDVPRIVNDPTSCGVLWLTAHKDNVWQ